MSLSCPGRCCSRWLSLRALELHSRSSSFFFFSSRRRHTRYIGDWSSDVCSSDLPALSSPLSDPKPEMMAPERMEPERRQPEPVMMGGMPHIEDNMDTAARVLSLAQLTADQAIADARREADETLGRARREADEVPA